MSRFLPFKFTDKQAIIFMGIQASGKTTFYEQMLADKGYTHISLDVLHTRNREDLLLAECLDNGRSFVVDNTNPEISVREKYIKKAKEYGYQVIGIFFQSKVRDCMRRNEQRGLKVPQKAIACTSNNLQLPSLDEGFDELYFVSININHQFKISPWRE